MAGVVTDGAHFVAERRNKQQIHIGKKARHLLADFAAETIGLNEIHGRKKTRLAEKVGPGVVCLHFQLIDAVGERELLERGGTFGEEIDIERAVRPIRKKDFDGAHAKFLDPFERSEEHTSELQSHSDLVCRLLLEKKKKKKKERQN